MQRHLAASILGAILWAGSAGATEVFDFTFSGNGVAVSRDMYGEVTGSFDFGWNGSLRVETLSGADGVYRLDDLVSFHLIANGTVGLGQWVLLTYGTPEASSDAGVPWVPASVRIENGAIVDVEAVDTFDYKGTHRRLELNGLQVKYEDRYSDLSGGGWEAVAAADLIPVTPIPEPATIGQVGAGLLGLGAAVVLRRRKSTSSKRGLSALLTVETVDSLVRRRP